MVTTMISRLSHYLDQLTRYVSHMGVQQWLLVLVGVIVVGLMCLRGYGSRSNY